MAANTTMSSKGQVIIPKDIREALHWETGTRLVVEPGESGVVLRAAAPVPVTRVEDLVGCVGYQGPKRTLAEMEAGVARGARRRRR